MYVIFFFKIILTYVKKKKKKKVIFTPSVRTSLRGKYHDISLMAQDVSSWNHPLNPVFRSLWYFFSFCSGRPERQPRNEKKRCKKSAKYYVFRPAFFFFYMKQFYAFSSLDYDHNINSCGFWISKCFAKLMNIFFLSYIPLHLTKTLDTSNTCLVSVNKKWMNNKNEGVYVINHCLITRWTHDHQPAPALNVFGPQVTGLWSEPRP